MTSPPFDPRSVSSAPAAPPGGPVPPAPGAGALGEWVRSQWENPGLPLRALSIPYAAGRALHRAVYSSGLKTRARLPSPVLCAGNLTAGGTGKTPFLAELAHMLMARGLRPAILSRGYGAIPPARTPRVVSDGVRALVSAAEAGDEPFLLARLCPGAPVVIGASRRDAGRLAIERFSPDLLLLDDGFQHEALARDADFVLWDLRDDPDRMRLLPAGRLREGLGALQRAAAIILTRGETLDPRRREETVNRTIARLKRHGPGAAVFEAETSPLGIRALAPSEPGAPLETPVYSPPGEAYGKRALLVSGLARPEGFEAMARGLGADPPAAVRLADHAPYGAAEIERIERRADELGAEWILTTEKDAVKLEASGRPLARWRALGLAMEIKEPVRWAAFLERVTAPAGKAPAGRGRRE